MLEKYQGVGTALITPFKEDLSIDYDALDKILDLQLSSGVDYLVVNGTTGEGSTIETEEKKELLEFIGKKVDKRVPIMYGIGANNTNYVLETIKSTDFKYIDSILSVAPYYNKPTQEGHYQHYKAIAEASPVPVFLYNVQIGRAHV